MFLFYSSGYDHLKDGPTLVIRLNQPCCRSAFVRPPVRVCRGSTRVNIWICPPQSTADPKMIHPSSVTTPTPVGRVCLPTPIAFHQ